MSAPTDVVVVVSANNNIPPIVKINQEVFKTEVK